jgi:glycosyltransferase involved in cell wall biosynthesis
VDGRFAPGRVEDAAAFRTRKGLPPRYLLFVGTLEPRKNLETLISAYAAWRARTLTGEQVNTEHDVHLVLAGARGWFYDEVFRRVAQAGLEERVHFAGYVPHDELPEWYRAAEACVYPSLFEGFGLPVLEAMACGTPVLCSAAPGVAEAAGDAALTVPPMDVGAWVAGLALMTGQPELRVELRRRGLVRAAGLSWRRAAEATLEVYATILE